MGHCPNPPVLLRPGLRHHTRRQDHLPLKVPPFHHTSTQAMPFACLSVSLNNAPPQSRTDRASFLKLRDGPSAPFLELRESKREDWGCLSSSSASSGLHCQTRECVMSSMTQCFHNPLLSDAVGSRRCRPALVGLKTARAGTRAAMTNEGGAAVVKASPRCWSCYVSSSIDQNDAHIRPALLNTCAYSFSCPSPPPVPAHRPSSPSSKRGSHLLPQQQPCRGSFSPSAFWRGASRASSPRASDPTSPLLGTCLPEGCGGGNGWAGAGPRKREQLAPSSC